MARIEDILGEAGYLAKQQEGFVVRPAQIQMSQRIAETIAARKILLVEAGTGTGKTFAYLVPALQSGAKVIISTGSRHLQDQLFKKDLPRLLAGLGHRPHALLKGRNNYLCLYRLEQTVDMYRWQLKMGFEDLDKVKAWSLTTDQGDINSLAEVAEDAPVWSLVTSTAESCLGSACAHYENCFVAKARARAQESQVVVVNHHLFLADAVMRDEGFAEILPQAEVIIFDEAHQLPDVASQFFGEMISSRQILDLVRDARTELAQAAADMGPMKEVLDTPEPIIAMVRQAMGEPPRRGKFMDIDQAVQQPMQDLEQALKTLHELLKSQAERSRGLEKLVERSAGLLQGFTQLHHARQVTEEVHWFEAFKQSWSLGVTPLDVQQPFQDMMAAHPAAWILTSATLAVDGDFSYFARQLGLSSADGEVFESPFDYAKQGLLYAPRNLPDPRQDDYLLRLVDEIRVLLAASQGRAFLLFTSHRALRQAAEMLHDLPWPVLVQGSQPRHSLLQAFREAGNAVLLGTGSFWEGVDVQGEALSLVVIDKLPFSSPGDPLLEARTAVIQQRGGSAFFELQLPQAIMSLKQGAGRLIRSISDRGVLVIADPRLYTQAYGRSIVAALPRMARTHDRAKVVDFFKKEEPCASVST